VFVNTNALDNIHKEIDRKDCKYNKPGMTTAPRGASIFELVDPFSHEDLFNEQEDT
jgi:hypothetical protein